MKYWLLTTEYPPFFGGGISTYCHYTALMLANKDHEVTVFVNDTAVQNFEISFQDKVRIIRFNPLRSKTFSFLGHVTNISYEFAQVVKEFIGKEGKPDIVEAQEYLGVAYYLLQFKHLMYDWCLDITVLITMHSPSFLYMEYNHVTEYRYPNYWICEMERFCLQAADILISPSRFMLDELAKRFTLHQRQVAVIPNPFTAGLLQPMESKGDMNEIVFFGKLTIQKGAFKLLGYFKQLWDEGFSRPLYLLGGQDIVYHPEGKTMGDLIRQRYKLYIDKGLLVMENKIKPAEIASRLANAEVVIIPSCNDNLPYVVFEMMALGKVLLVSRQGGQYEVITEGINGFVFDHDQPGTFSAQLKKILALPRTEKERIGREARNNVLAQYNSDTIYNRKMAAITAHKPERKEAFPFIRPLNRAAEENSAVFQKDLLSVVVPYFNMGAYVHDTMDALSAVGYPEKEIILVNDGSTDDQSLAVLDQYRNRPGVRVLDTPNKGLAHARNFGAQNANGEFLAFLDSDDRVDPNYYSKATRVLKQYSNVHFVGSWTKYFEGSQNTWPTFTPEPPLILYHNLVNSSALVYRRSSFLSGGINDRTMTFQGLEDYESVVGLLDNGYQGVVLPETLFHYRVRRNSMIRAVSQAKKLILLHHISQKHNRFYATFATDLFNLLNANGPGIHLDNPSLDLHLTDRLPFLGRFSGRVIHLVKKNRIAKTIAYKIYRLINK